MLFFSARVPAESRSKFLTLLALLDLLTSHPLPPPRFVLKHGWPREMRIQTPAFLNLPRGSVLVEDPDEEVRSPRSPPPL